MTIGIVVVNYGSTGLIATSLGAVTRSLPDVMGIVIDNFHSPAERAAITELGAVEHWDIVLCNENLGFGAAANVGIARAAGHGCDVVLVLNPDARLAPDDCLRLAEQARSQPTALLAPRINRADGRPWFVGGRLDMRRGAVSAAREAGPEEVTWLTGACLIATTRSWLAFGPFPDSYFMYWEDIELSWCWSQRGGSLVVVRDVVAIHDVGGSQTSGSADRAKSPLYYRYNCRNRLLFAARNLTRRELLRWLLHTPGQSTAIFLRGGRRQLLNAPAGGLAAARGTAEGVWIAIFALVLPKRFHRQNEPQRINREEVTT